jgi:hypothetical protein
VKGGYRFGLNPRVEVEKQTSFLIFCVLILTSLSVVSPLVSLPSIFD